MPEELHTCPGCGRANFTARGLKAHRCRPADSGVPPVTRDPSTGGAAAALPPLPAIVEGIAKARATLDAAERQHQRNTLADRVWIGVLCLQGKEHHAIPVQSRKQGRKGNYGNLKITSHVRSGLQPTALAIHPQGFLAWLDLALSGIPQPTLYRYMAAARGIGLDAWSTEDETRALVAQRLREFDERQQSLTLAMLATQGKEPAETTPPARKSADDIKTDAVQTLFSFMDEVVNVKDALTPVERDAVVNRVAEILRRLTGQEWSPVS